jgi:hypothetical protein
VHILKRVVITCSLFLLMGGATAVGANAATAPANNAVSASAPQSNSLLPAKLPSCGPLLDGEVVFYQGKYWQCGYVMGLGWFWWEIPPPVGCGPVRAGVARETLRPSC